MDGPDLEPPAVRPAALQRARSRGGWTDRQGAVGAAQGARAARVGRAGGRAWAADPGHLRADELRPRLRRGRRVDPALGPLAASPRMRSRKTHPRSRRIWAI